MNRSALPLVQGVYGLVRMLSRRRLQQTLANALET